MTFDFVACMRRYTVTAIDYNIYEKNICVKIAQNDSHRWVFTREVKCIVWTATLRHFIHSELFLLFDIFVLSR